MRPLRHRTQDFVRGAIWDAAADLFAARGYDHTTVDDIARAAGVSRRSFFRYFSSKSDLMGQGMVSYGDYITAAIAAAPAAPAAVDLMRHVVRQVAVTAAAYPRVRKIAHVASTSVAAREAQLSRLAELEDRVAGAYRLRLRTPARDTLTPRLLAELTLSILDVTFREWFKQKGDDIVPTADDVFAALLRVVSPVNSRPARFQRRSPRTRPTSPPSGSRRGRRP